MRPFPALTPALAAAALVVGVSSCGLNTDDGARDRGSRSTDDAGSPSRSGDGATAVPTEWWTILDEQFGAAEDQESTVPTIDLDGRCELGDGIEVAGDDVGQHGTGASAFGDSGRRYICEFSDPVAVDVIVARFTEPGEYDDLVASLAADGFHDVDVDGATFSVQKSEAGNGAYTDFTVTHLVEDRHGFVTLSLALTDDAQRSSFTDERAAEVLARFMRA